MKKVNYIETKKKLNIKKLNENKIINNKFKRRIFILKST